VDPYLLKVVDEKTREIDRLEAENAELRRKLAEKSDEGGE
jgi:hypothetical protein